MLPPQVAERAPTGTDPSTDVGCREGFDPDHGRGRFKGASGSSGRYAGGRPAGERLLSSSHSFNCWRRCHPTSSHASLFFTFIWCLIVIISRESCSGRCASHELARESFAKGSAPQKTGTGSTCDRNVYASRVCLFVGSNVSVLVSIQVRTILSPLLYSLLPCRFRRWISLTSKLDFSYG